MVVLWSAHGCSESRATVNGLGGQNGGHNGVAEKPFSFPQSPLDWNFAHEETLNL